MPLYLKSGAEIVAELGPELPRPDPNTRAWPLRPTPRFERVRPVVAAMNAMQYEPMAPVPATIASIPDERERGLAIQSWIRTDPQAQNRSRVYDRFQSLELLITDETGVPLSDCTVMVAELPPASGPFSSDMRSDFEERGFQAGPPFYMAVAVSAPPPLTPFVGA
jgi:hypothetical protein